MYLLLVDSDVFTSADMKEMLKHAPAGSDIVNTYSAKTLLRVANKISPDIIIVDFDLIDEESDDIFNDFRSLSEKAHILVLIDSDHYEKLFEAIEHAGVDDYIVKPIRKEELIARVQIASRRKRLPAAKHEAAKLEHVVIEEQQSEDELAPLKEDLEEASGFSFDVHEEEPADEPFLAAVTEEPEADISPAPEIAPEEEEFKIYDDPEMADMFEPDEHKVETESVQKADGFGFDDADDDEIEDLNIIKATSETEHSFDDIEEPLDLQPGTVEQPQAEPQLEKQDFDFLDDFPDDEALPLPAEDSAASESIDNLFDEDDFTTGPITAEPDSEKVEEDLFSTQDKASTNFEEVVEDEEEEDPWNFDSLSEEEDKQQKKVKPDVKTMAAASFLDEDELFSDQAKPEPSALEVDDSDSYFDDLFAEEPPKREAPPAAEDDLFGSDDFAQQPVERKPVKPKSDLPGKTADDFLYGETSFNDEKDDQGYNQSMLDEFTFDQDDEDDKDEEDDKPKRKSRKTPRKGKGSGGGFPKLLSIIGNIVFVALLLMMATLSFFLIQSRITGGVPQVAGYQMYIVLSGSMSPEFDTGSLAFVKETPPEQVVVGDIITFRSQAGSVYLTTHRVVEVNREDGLRFITRGDANNVNDPNPVLAENIVGRVTGSIPYLGYLMNFVQTRQGLILLIFVPGVLIIVYELGKIMKYLTESRREETA